MKVYLPPSRGRNPSNSVHLELEFNAARLTPRGIRRRFVLSLRAAIARARLVGAVDEAICEELWRTVPDPERIA